MQQVVPNSHMKAPSLSLDHELVLSAWEQIGGDIFLGDDFDIGPLSIDIDLSSIEASLKQSSSASLDKFSNITPVPNLFPSIPDFSFPPPNFGLPDADIKGQEKPMHWQQQCIGLNNSTPASVSKCPPPQVKIEATVQDPQGSCSSLSSNSADIAIVPEVTSHPAARSAQTGSSLHSIPQPFVPNLLPPVGPSLIPAVKQIDSEVWRTRKECLERYKEKKARRMYTKKIRYQLRKINADKRPRIKGRFVKKEELDEYMKTQPSKATAIAEEDECSEVDEDEEMSEGL